MRRPRSAVLAPVALALGAVALFLAEAQILRVGAALLLIVGIVLGVFAIATPAFLEGDRDS